MKDRMKDAPSFSQLCHPLEEELAIWLLQLVSACFSSQSDQAFFSPPDTSFDSTYQVDDPRETPQTAIRPNQISIINYQYQIDQVPFMGCGERTHSE
jgi:hypothetical protein